MNIMHLRFRDSLLMSMGIVMSAITLLAFASMTASIFIADTTQGLATAINESGALRMRSYRIASNLTHHTPDNKQHWQKTFQLITEFENHLYSNNLSNVLSDNNKNKITFAYNKIKDQWQDEIKPLFTIYLDGIAGALPGTSDGLDMSISEDAVDNLRNRYLLVVPDFVNNIDHLVTLLEENAETKIQELHHFQLIAIVLTILLTITALIIIYKRIQIPLKQLLTGAKRVSQRDFSFTIKYTGQDELGRLGSAFNAMAEDLSKIYDELEERIQNKTIDLEQSNHSLQLLYKTVNCLNEAESPHLTYTTILQDIEKTAGIGKATICLNDNKIENPHMLASILYSNDKSSQRCAEPDCRKCLSENKTLIKTINHSKNQTKTIIAIPINDQNIQHGTLIIEPDDGTTIETWLLQLLETIASHIGMAIKLFQQSTASRRLILIEERGAIARELHDSLAQSLTYMKIQLSRLQAIAHKNNTESEEINIIAEMREGLNSAYRELRELLTTFRLKIDGKDFNEALIKTVIEFNDRSETQITFTNQIAYCNLTPNEEIHILQLIREALSNTVQHAQATLSTVSIQHTADDDIKIIISDNGIGIDNAPSKTHHYGLNIMKERAKTLDGILEISNNSEGGTQVILVFTPTNAHAPVHLNIMNE